MAKNSRRNRNQNNNQNTGNNSQGKEKKGGFFSGLKHFPENHPKIWRGGKIAVGSVTLGLAAIGGYGAKEAIKDRMKKPATPNPTPVMPDVPDIPVVPDPVTTDDRDME